jgi:hypothetical protein
MGYLSDNNIEIEEVTYSNLTSAFNRKSNVSLIKLGNIDNNTPRVSLG